MTFKEDSKSITDEMLENLAYWQERVDEFDDRENRRLSNFKPYTEVFPTPELNEDGTVKRDADVTNASERKAFHLAGKHDQKTHGRGGGKAGGARPSSMSKEEYMKAQGVGVWGDDAMDKFRKEDGSFDFENHGDEIQAISQKRREAEREWEYDTRDAVTMGELDPNEAEKRGLGHPSAREWEELPPTVYHVTTNASAIREGGGELKTREELNATGLGGGAEDTISFTTDPEMAVIVEHGLREGVAVAKGDITTEDLLQNAATGADAERPYLKDVIGGGIASIGGNSRWKEGDPLPEQWEELRAGRKVESDKMFYSAKDLKPGEKLFGNRWHSKDGTEHANAKSRPMTDDEKLSTRFQLYKTAAFMRQHAGGPEDPLFFNADPKYLATVKKDDIKRLKYKPKPGAKGVRPGGMKELRTFTGKATTFEEELPPTDFGGKFSEHRQREPYKFHLAGRHDQKAHAKGRSRAAGGDPHDRFRKKFGEYDSASGIPAKESAENAQQQSGLMRDSVRPEFHDRFDEYKEDQALDYIEGPLVHGTTVNGAVEVYNEGLQSRGAMRRETLTEIDNLKAADFIDEGGRSASGLKTTEEETEKWLVGHKEALRKQVEGRGASYPADAEAGLDEFVFMTHGEGAGYGDVDVIIDNKVLDQGGTIGTASDVLGVHAGEMKSYSGDPNKMKGADFKDEAIPKSIASNYRKQQVNGGEDYDEVATSLYASGRARMDDYGVGETQGKLSMEVKATHVKKEDVKGFATSDSSAAVELIDRGIPAEKVYVWDHDSTETKVNEKFGYTVVGVADEWGEPSYDGAVNHQKHAALRAIQKGTNIEAEIWETRR